MKRLFAYITLPLLLVCAAASAQESVSPLDSVDLGNLYRFRANEGMRAGSDVFEKSPEVDIANALYGQFSGLLVKNSSSTYDSNRSRLKLSLRLHGHSPLLLVDGFPRDLDDLEGWRSTRSRSSRMPPPRRCTASRAATASSPSRPSVARTPR